LEPKMKIEITDSISKTIKYPPVDKEQCDWCLKWVDVTKIDIIENKSPQGGYEFVCEGCLNKVEE